MWFLVDERRKIIFGWSAKCGCSHIKNIWYSVANPSIALPIHTDNDFNSLPDTTSEYDVVLIIRNPYKRLISGFIDKYSSFGEKRHMWTLPSLTFRIFVKELLKENWIEIDAHHFVPQTTEMFNECALQTAKTLKIFDIERVDYSYIEALFGESIPKSAICKKFGHERPKFEGDFCGNVSDLETRLYETKNVKMHQFYDDEILNLVTEYYKSDFAFFKKHGFDYEQLRQELTHPLNFECELTRLANKYKTDKGSTYKCAHHYTRHYQQIISDLVRDHQTTQPVDLLEIGLSRDGTESMPSLMMWNDYFCGNINITGFDIRRDFLKFNGAHPNIRIFCGDQSIIGELNQLKYKTYDIIIDDGWHASKHQQISLKTLWASLNPGGYYIIENLHFQPIDESGLKTKQLFENWKSGVWITTEWIGLMDICAIAPEIESIQFSDSNSNNFDKSILKHAFVFIKKKHFD